MRSDRNMARKPRGARATLLIAVISSRYGDRAGRGLTNTFHSSLFTPALSRHVEGNDMLPIRQFLPALGRSSPTIGEIDENESDRTILISFSTDWLLGNSQYLRKKLQNFEKRWQRRWFVLYDDGELSYSVDEHVSIG
ncbi:hypothetical protein C0J52_25701 [Blattella germanica]|nr:hypothetical protein C0J52_25701 [Blattella germanica]